MPGDQYRPAMRLGSDVIGEFLAVLVGKPAVNGEAECPGKLVQS